MLKTFLNFSWANRIYSVIAYTRFIHQEFRNILNIYIPGLFVRSYRITLLQLRLCKMKFPYCFLACRIGILFPYAHHFVPFPCLSYEATKRVSRWQCVYGMGLRQFSDNLYSLVWRDRRMPAQNAATIIKPLVPNSHWTPFPDGATCCWMGCTIPPQSAFPYSSP